MFITDTHRTNLRPIFGSKVVDIRDFGAIADDPSIDNSIAIQAAHDYLIQEDVLRGGSSSWANTGKIYVPSGTWYCYHPVFIDGDFVEIVGEGASSIVSSGSMDIIVFIFGFKRYHKWLDKIPIPLVQPLPLLPIYIPETQRTDLFKELDESAASTKGQRWAIHTRQYDSPYKVADHSIVLHASPASHGPRFDGWESTDVICAEIAYKMDLSKVAESVSWPLFGVGEPVDTPNFGPAPYFITVNSLDGVNKQFHVWFRCEEDGYGLSGMPDYRVFTFGDTMLSEGQKIAFQINMHKNDKSGLCEILAWQNDIQVPISRYQGTNKKDGDLAFTAEQGLHFRQNDLCAFTIASWRGWQAVHHRITPLTLHGLRVGVGEIYKDTENGTPQQRIDATTLNDYRRYFSVDASTLFYLPLTDQPHNPTHPHNRFVTVQHGPAGQGNLSYGFLTEDQATIYGQSTTSNAIRNVTVRSNFNGWGMAIGLGAAYHFTAEDCGLHGGYWAAGDIGGGGYYYEFRNLECSAWDAALAKSSAYIFLDHLLMGRIARKMIVLDGCNAVLKHLIANGPVKHHAVEGYLGIECFVKLNGFNGYGVNIVVDYLFSDSEEDVKGGRFKASIYAERIATDPQNGGTTLRVKDILSNASPSAPAIWLADRWPNEVPPAIFTLEGLVSAPWAIKTDGPNWSGEIPTHAFGPNVRKWVQHDGPGESNIVVNRLMPGKPTSGYWLKGARIKNISGEPNGYVCISGGDFDDPELPNPKFVEI